MSRTARPLLVLLTLLLMAMPALAGDVTDTWKKRLEVQPQGVADPVPVVLYVHGCDGARLVPAAAQDTDAWAATVTKAGWRFTIPDSWARGTWSRPDGCPTATTRPPLETVLKIRLMRSEEIGYAVARLTEDPTVDHSRIVLFGHSEGGIAVATAAPPPGIRGVIISGWTCHAVIPLGMGIAAPPSVPVLALGFERDTVISVQGRCSEFFPGRADTSELILPGAGHLTGGFASAREAVADFLGRLR